MDAMGYASKIWDVHGNSNREITINKSDLEKTQNL
jgi:hypothetical protein